MVWFLAGDPELTQNVERTCKKSYWHSDKPFYMQNLYLYYHEAVFIAFGGRSALEKVGGRANDTTVDFKF